MIPNDFTRELEPFFFGGDVTPLYGCFHPSPNSKRDYVAVFCYPFGDEMIRIHRAYKQLAVRLSRAGVPVLRFDYFGWGDSAGEDTEATLTRWEQDVETAIEEAKKLSGAKQVVLLGLRLGASLALRVASHRQDVNAIVLWEPVVNGEDYLQELTEAHEHRLNYFFTEPILSPSVDITELLGFSLSSTMKAEIHQIDLLQLNFSMPGRRVLVVEKDAKNSVAQLRNHLQSQSFQVDYQDVDDPAIWEEDPDKALIPIQTSNAIMNWFSELLV
jgi:pimeloyl-ACP methyl ester carboxylesterase